MLDTTRIRFYGVNDIKNDTLSTIKTASGDIYDNRFVCDSHQNLYLAIMKAQKKNVSITKIVNKETYSDTELDENDFSVLNNHKKDLNFHYQHRKTAYFIDEKRVKENSLNTYGSYRVPSSQSNVSFTVNENAGYIDFECSIPKYCFGHSLAEFIPQSKSRYFRSMGTKLHNLDAQILILYDRFFRWIKDFVLDIFITFGIPDEIPDFRYIELRRIDFCYNQHFKDKATALSYLDYQKKLHLKGQRVGSHVGNNFATSINYKTSSGGYFKIYHKGSEYSKSEGDLVKHLGINNEFIDEIIRAGKSSKEFIENLPTIKKFYDTFGRDDVFHITDKQKIIITDKIRKLNRRLPFHIPFLKKEMDKVLRYELSLNSSALSSIYKRHVFRKNDPEHKKAKKRYNRVKNFLDARKSNTEHQLSKHEYKQYELFHKHLNSACSILFETNKKIMHHEKTSVRDYSSFSESYLIRRVSYRYTILSNKDIGTLCPLLLKCCYDRFMVLVMHYQVKQLQKFDDVAGRVAEYNKTVELNVKKYNESHRSVVDINNRRFMAFPEKGKYVTKATQLLTESQKHKKGLKKINPTTLLLLVDQINKGISIETFFRKTKVSSSAKSRHKKNLALFGIFENTLKTTVSVNAPLCFTYYYSNTSTLNYRNDFYNRGYDILNPPFANE